jgi:general secretion pathway protein A
MYCKFFGLKEKPFNTTSDPAFFFLSNKHKEALAHLHYGVAQRKGIMLLTGEIGTGKTTLCRFFLSELKKNVKTAFILNPRFSETQLLESIVLDFGIKSAGKGKFELIRGLNNFLLKESAKGNNVVLIIDEAQNLKPELLEQVRLLSNLETEKEKLLQIILVGQPELNEKLGLYGLRQLRQRIMVKYHILPLEGQEIDEYIKHRLKIAGLKKDRIDFSQEAIATISEFSSGMPRLINMVCDRALLSAFAKETAKIEQAIVNQCLDELNDYKTGGKP